MKNRETVFQVTILLAIVLVSFMAFRLGFYVASQPEDRQPAAIPRVYDYSHLVGPALQQAARDRLVNGAKVVTAGPAAGLELGHFTVRNDSGQVVGACEIYEEMEIVFHADGMAVSGEPPEMTVVGPCQPADDVNAIAPIMIPYEKVLNLPVADTELADFADPSVKVSFRNVSDEWPRIWVVQSVRLHGDKSGDVQVGKEDFRRLLGKAPTFEWQ